MLRKNNHMITDINQLDLTKKYTYKDYLTWQFDERVELIRGKVVRMSPAPGTSHQRASSNLHVAVGSYLRKKPCNIFSAPFDVKLPSLDKSKKEETVVQPDLSIVCDVSKLDEKGCKGPPDWIIEILSKSSANKDLTDKYELYQNAGVKEYWIVHPAEGTITPYILSDEGKYELTRNTPFSSGEIITVGIFPDLEIPLAEVFD
ncbi:MAG: Uma2 family endonuclease [Bacteroidota bacterium]